MVVIRTLDEERQIHRWEESLALPVIGSGIKGQFPHTAFRMHLDNSSNLKLGLAGPFSNSSIGVSRRCPLRLGARFGS